MKQKRVWAIIAICLLVSMYLITLILAIVSSPAKTYMAWGSLCCTVAIPIVIYIFRMFVGLTKPKPTQTDENGQPTRSVSVHRMRQFEKQVLEEQQIQSAEEATDTKQ